MEPDKEAQGTSLSLSPPDDFHVHLRDGDVLSAVSIFTARQFRRALVMPNLVPPVRRVPEALEYRDRILASLPEDVNFEPLMALYLTDDTTIEDVQAAADCPHVLAYKLYPSGATTNSAYGVTSLPRVYDALAEMERQDIVLCVHGEVTGVDIFEREQHFIHNSLPGLLRDFPRLRIVLEHATTAVAAAAVENAAASGARLAATLTPHHLLHSRNALFEGARVHPDMFCLPILKRETDRLALLRAATGPHAAHFFAGTDSAPHTRDKKLCEAGCAGIFNAPAAISLYAAAFEEIDALSKLSAFLSENGAAFYNLPANEGEVVLRAAPQKVPATVAVRGQAEVRPLAAGETLQWWLGQ